MFYLDVKFVINYKLEKLPENKEMPLDCHLNPEKMLRGGLIHLVSNKGSVIKPDEVNLIIVL